MSKLLVDVEKITAAAAEVENVAWSRAVQIQILDAFDICFHPWLDVGVFRNLDGRVGVTRFDLADPVLIEAFEQWAQRDGMKPPLKSAPAATVRFQPEKFGDFVSDLHRSMNC